MSWLFWLLIGYMAGLVTGPLLIIEILRWFGRR